MGLSEFVSVAEGEIGNGGTKYRDWYPIGSSDAWCSAFVSWCADQADIMTTNITGAIPLVYKSAGVTTMYNWYQTNRRNLAPSTDPSSINYPRVGDVVCIRGTEHSGIVVNVSGNVVETVEGNYNNQVSRVTYTDLVSGNNYISYICSNNVSY